MHENLARELFALGPLVRYVAFGQGQDVALRQRDGLHDASDPVSDRFEELFVNPALITLARQRGELDCGGFLYVAIRYGSFIQLLTPTTGGHVSIALEPDSDIARTADAVASLLEAHGLQSRASSPVSAEAASRPSPPSPCGRLIAATGTRSPVGNTPR